ncbi:hypothetical protein JYT87_01040 [Nitrospira defluvii]|nr:hypothetical protein [Nitrospira defluvii]
MEKIRSIFNPLEVVVFDFDYYGKKVCVDGMVTEGSMKVKFVCPHCQADPNRPTIYGKEENT